jgi:hypothetical protein
MRRWWPKTFLLYFSEYFQGADAVILVDNDKAGHEHAEMVAKNLSPVVARLRVLYMPAGTPDKGDISWWIECGTTADQINAMLDTAPDWATSDAQDQSADEVDQASPWIDRCILSSRGSVRPILANVLLGMREDPAMVGLLAYDEMQSTVLLLGPVPRFGEQSTSISGTYPRPLRDDDVIQIQEWFQIAGLPGVGKDVMHDAVDRRARECGFHPVRDYLTGLKWDGVERLETWLPYYLGTEDNQYTRAIGRMFMVAAVVRILRPGCKWITCLCLKVIRVPVNRLPAVSSAVTSSRTAYRKT